jgi:hypothetical protein
VASSWQRLGCARVASLLVAGDRAGWRGGAGMLGVPAVERGAARCAAAVPIMLLWRDLTHGFA